MSRGRKQILVASIILAAILGCYFGVKEYNAEIAKKEQAKENEAITQVTDFEIAEVTAFSYTSADLEVGFTFDGENWKNTADESLEIDAEKIESFLENFNAIESENDVPETESLEEFGLDQPMSSITFEFADGEHLTCTVGGYNDVMGVYYFMTDASEAVYTVDGTVTNKLSNTVENFVVEEAEETESEESTDVSE